MLFSESAYLSVETLSEHLAVSVSNSKIAAFCRWRPRKVKDFFFPKTMGDDCGRGGDSIIDLLLPFMSLFNAHHYLFF